MPINEEEALIAERTSMFEMLQTLTADEWNADSLCEGWRVRDVASHVQLGVTLGVLRLARGLLVNRGDFNAFMSGYARQLGNRTTREILATWEDVATTAKIPPTTKRVELAMDCHVHHHDICIPLGRDVPSDPARMRWMADAMVAAGKPTGSGPRVEGLRLVATDIDWHYGTGPEVHGPAVALLLAGCGRRALDDQLTGDGVAELVRRG